jgi:hypothetical protein
MLTFFTVLLVLVALLLICVILIQEPKSTGGGLFSGTGQSLLGTSGRLSGRSSPRSLPSCSSSFAWDWPPYRAVVRSSLADDIQKDQQRAAEAAAAAVTQADPKTDVGAQKAPARKLRRARRTRSRRSKRSSPPRGSFRSSGVFLSGIESGLWGSWTGGVCPSEGKSFFAL